MDRLREAFLKPSDEYTPIPFWFWNDDLKKEEIVRQINDFKEKGVMGFVIHPRIGIPENIAYLSDEFMDYVKCAVEEAAKNGMKVVLYDEAMYPSGSAHGMVVRDNPEYASRGLRMVEHKCDGITKIPLALSNGDEFVAALAVRKTGDTSIDPEFTTVLEPENGFVKFTAPDDGMWSILLFVETFTHGHIRGIHFGEDDREPNAPPSSDLLNPRAVEKFIRLTHQRYYDVLKDYFGTTIIAMFTDEPDIMGRGAARGLRPWTKNFMDWCGQYGIQRADLPLLWFDGGENTAAKRKQYRKAVIKKMEISYYKPIYEWCTRHGIALTGHPAGSDDIGLLKYFHIPGQDVVWRWVAPDDVTALEGVHSTMAKCSSDAARHSGKRRNANECFACCGKNRIEWSFTADDMKWYMDWLFVRGVNLLYPHAFFYSINGRRRIMERPPDVGPNNIWWPYYRKISDYIKRMCWLMTDSVNQARVAILCEEDHLPWEAAKVLFQNQIEFNYLEYNLLLESSACIDRGVIRIGKQTYNVLVIEDPDVLEADVKERISKFVSGGGMAIIYDPSHQNMVLTGCTPIDCLEQLPGIVSSYAGVDFAVKSPCRDLRMSHVVKEDKHFYVLVNEGNDKIDTIMTVSIQGSAEKWDAWRGTVEECIVTSCENGSMSIPLVLDRRESIVVCIDPSSKPDIKSALKSESIIAADFIAQGWRMVLPSDRNLEIDNLVSWTEIPEMQEFSGTITYTNEFVLNNMPPGSSVKLDLGEVHEIARVFVNGKDAGVCMWSPYVFDITELVHTGTNHIRIDVTNTRANSICKAGLVSGLMGPVSLKVVI